RPDVAASPCAAGELVRKAAGRGVRRFPPQTNDRRADEPEAFLAAPPALRQAAEVDRLAEQDGAGPAVPRGPPERIEAARDDRDSGSHRDRDRAGLELTRAA